MKRSLLPTLIAAVALLGSSLVPAQATSPAPAPPYFGTVDLPDVDDVARIYPQYEGGSTELSRATSLLSLRAFNRACGGLQEVARANQGVLGHYLTQAGGSGSDDGTAPYLLLQDFGSADRARTALADARTRTLACRGSHPVGSASHTVAVKPLAGFAGQQRVAWIDTVRPAQGRAQALLIAYLRRDRFIVGGIFTQDVGTPGVKKAELLLQQALDALGSRRGPG